jgi:hypothetical protein
VEAKTTIQAIVEREWSTTRRTRSRQVLARWLDHQGGPGVLASAKRAEQALGLATQPFVSSKRGAARFASIPALPPAAAPADTRVARAAAITPGDQGRPSRPRLLTARAAFEVVYTQDDVDAADR